MSDRLIAISQPSLEEKERRNRIMLSVYAYAYEYDNNSLVSDHEFDNLAFSIDTSVGTNNPQMDDFFKTKFSPSTGMWIRSHPDLSGISRIYRLLLDSQKTIKGLK